MSNKQALYDELIDNFILYQHRLDCPMPPPTETFAVMVEKYRSDPVFHAKVESLVRTVMFIVEKHRDE